jgi:hypothetical protein
MSNVEGNPNDRMTNNLIGIPSEVENGAAGDAATWTARPQAERTGSERIKSYGHTEKQFRGILRLRFASLRMTVSHSDVVIVSSSVIRHSSFSS